MRKPIALGGLLLFTLACNKTSADNSRVLANVGGEKITELDFKNTLAGVVPAAQLKQVLEDPQAASARARMLAQLAQQRAMIALGRAEGVDKETAVRLQIDEATAKAYAQQLIQRRMPAQEPTEAQLQDLYRQIVAQRQAMGQAQAIPPFEQVKAQLIPAWKQQQAEKSLEQDLKEKIPTTLAEDMKATGAF
jgi:hypothetical protein